ncbi:hypothetical protein D3C80_1373200 [compost metagenome]
MVHGHADLHFVQADIEGAFNADAVIRRQQDERPLGHGMARAGDDHGVGVGQHASSQSGAGGDQGDGVLRAGSHDLEVVPAGKNARLPGDYHHGAVLLGAVQGRIEGGDHIRRDGIHLAIGKGQGGDAVFELVGDQLTHGRFLVKKWADVTQRYRGGKGLRLTDESDMTGLKACPAGVRRVPFVRQLAPSRACLTRLNPLDRAKGSWQ